MRVCPETRATAKAGLDWRFAGVALVATSAHLCVLIVGSSRGIGRQSRFAAATGAADVLAGGRSHGEL
jgi:hypothetical protein